MRGSKLLFIASWVILLIVAALVTLASLGSAITAYTNQPDQLGSTLTLEKIREYGGDEAVQAHQGRRATAATYALGYALLSLWVVLVPYRRGERWAWWALLVSMAVSQLISIARVIMIGTTAGAGAAGILLAIFLLGLMAGVPRIFSKQDELIEI